MTSEQTERGLDLFRHGDFPIYTLTFARNLAPAELLSRMGVDGATVAMRDPVDMSDDFGDDLYDDEEPVVRAGTTGAWAWAWEEGGVHGLDARILRGVSAGTEVVALHYNEKPMYAFAYAVEGDVVTTFDTLMAVSPEGSDPKRLAEHMRRAGLVAGEWAELYGVLALVEDAFGIRFTREQLNDEPRLSGRLRPLPE
ncbi:DUF6461 domain-containing protein [Streptomyces sp. NPDC006984]|uniref:DUF6461 domain-containing protein n=1 Tax=Streptomyces sp. NPDC006984 TaxID=3155463 RepID=UPI0033F271FD